MDEKKLTAKDVGEIPMLMFIASSFGMIKLSDIERLYPTFPVKLVLAKLRSLIRRGLITGCACGCRGDFEITDKGMKHCRDIGIWEDAVGEILDSVHTQVFPENYT